MFYCTFEPQFRSFFINGVKPSSSFEAMLFVTRDLRLSPCERGNMDMSSPKLGALWRVMSRMTLVPKHDHISRNCWATFFRHPGLLPAT